MVCGNYFYVILFMFDDKGIIVKMELSGGIEFNLDDEVIFMDVN